MKSYRKGSSNNALEVLSYEQLFGLTCLVGLTLLVDRWGIIMDIMITSRWCVMRGTRHVPTSIARVFCYYIATTRRRNVEK